MPYIKIWLQCIYLPVENYPSIFDFMLANHDMMESEMTYFFN